MEHKIVCAVAEQRHIAVSVAVDKSSCYQLVLSVYRLFGNESVLLGIVTDEVYKSVFYRYIAYF